MTRTGNLMVAAILVCFAGVCLGALLFFFSPLWLWTFPSLEEIAAARPPERGDWRKVCELQGYQHLYQAELPGSDQKGVWVFDDVSVSLLEVSTCTLTPATWIPEGALLADGKPDGHAIWFKDRTVFYSAPSHGDPIAIATAEGMRRSTVKLSLDAEWVAWIRDTDEYASGAPFELGVRRLDGAQPRIVTLDRDPHPVRLLAYDPETGESTVEIDYNKMARFDEYGGLISEPLRPCGGEIIGSFTLHPIGWLYYGAGRDCGLWWELDGRQGQQRLSEFGGLGSFVASASVDLSGRLAAVVSSIPGHHTEVHEAVFVFRIGDGSEVFRRHLPLTHVSGYGESSFVSFVGLRHVAVTHDSVVQVFRIPDQSTAFSL